jgi:hypothetical protein
MTNSIESTLKLPAADPVEAARPVGDLGHRHRMVMAAAPQLRESTDSPVRDLGLQYRLLMPWNDAWSADSITFRLRTAGIGFGDPVKVPAQGAVVNAEVVVVAQSRLTVRDASGRRSERVRPWPDDEAWERAEQLLAERAGLTGGELEVGPSTREGGRQPRDVWFHSRRLLGRGMTVSDVDLLDRALDRGVGRGRGYGFGMLTVV